MTKHFNNFYVLVLGRLLGGFSTSILWSAFESWMVSEHHSRGFEGDWIGGTFSLAVAGNGLVAIASGFAAQGAVWAYNGHPVAPFDLSALALIIGTLLITFTWPENYGDAQSSQTQGLQKAIAAVRADSRVCINLIAGFFIFRSELKRDIFLKSFILH